MPGGTRTRLPREPGLRSFLESWAAIVLSGWWEAFLLLAGYLALRWFSKLRWLSNALLLASASAATRETLFLLGIGLARWRLWCALCRKHYAAVSLRRLALPPGVSIVARLAAPPVVLGGFPALAVAGLTLGRSRNGLPLLKQGWARLGAFADDALYATRQLGEEAAGDGKEVKGADGLVAFVKQMRKKQKMQRKEKKNKKLSMKAELAPPSDISYEASEPKDVGVDGSGAVPAAPTPGETSKEILPATAGGNGGKDGTVRQPEQSELSTATAETLARREGSILSEFSDSNNEADNAINLSGTSGASSTTPKLNLFRLVLCIGKSLLLAAGAIVAGVLLIALVVSVLATWIVLYFLILLAMLIYVPAVLALFTVAGRHVSTWIVVAVAVGASLGTDIGRLRYEWIALALFALPTYMLACYCFMERLVDETLESMRVRLGDEHRLAKLTRLYRGLPVSTAEAVVKFSDASFGRNWAKPGGRSLGLIPPRLGGCRQGLFVISVHGGEQNEVRCGFVDKGEERWYMQGMLARRRNTSELVGLDWQGQTASKAEGDEELGLLDDLDDDVGELDDRDDVFSVAGSFSDHHALPPV